MSYIITFVNNSFQLVTLPGVLSQMTRSNLPQSVCLSVCPVNRQQPRRAAGLLLSADGREISIDSGGSGAQQQMRAVLC